MQIQKSSSNQKIKENPNKTKKIQSEITISDFKLTKVLGKGSFGKVVLGISNMNDELYYAIKMIKKKNIIKDNKVKRVLQEKSILEEVSHPFILDLKYSFQDMKKIYFVTEFCQGGELFFHLSKVGHFNEKAIRFYASQIVIIFEYLHSKGILYKDLKPENILVNYDGFIKLADFGLAEKISEYKNHVTYDFSGTPQYISPEMISEQGSSYASDWWSLGVLLYELGTGVTPFRGKNTKMILTNIQNMCYNKDEISHLSLDLQDLIMNLLKYHPEERINTSDKVKSHRFFNKYDFNMIINKTIKPPFIPRLINQNDTKYFSSDFLNLDIISEVTSSENDFSIEDRLFSPIVYVKKGNKNKNILNKIDLFAFEKSFSLEEDVKDIENANTDYDSNEK